MQRVLSRSSHQESPRVIADSALISSDGWVGFGDCSVRRSALEWERSCWCGSNGR